MRTHLCGDRALLIDVDQPAGYDSPTDAVLALTERLREVAHPGIIDLVPAAQTLLIHLDPAVLSLEEAQRLLDDTGLPPATASTGSGETHRIPVSYDGPDLEDLASSLGITTAELIARHSGTTWRAAFGGFAPGFFYLSAASGPGLGAVPRRSEPRTAIPAGSVALAGEWSAVYPGSSPGGWQIIGFTETPFWDSAAERPALLRAGDLVEFYDKEHA